MRKIEIEYELTVQDKCKTKKLQYTLQEKAGEVFLDELQVLISYQIREIKDGITIQISQSDCDVLLYSLQVKFKHKGQAFSFNQQNAKAQIIQDEFLGVGFKGEENTIFIHPGLAYENDFEQIYRIRKGFNAGGFTKNTILNDLELVAIGEHEISFKYGESYNLFESKVIKAIDVSTDILNLEAGYYAVKINNQSNDQLSYYLQDVLTRDCVELEYQSCPKLNDDIQYFQILKSGSYQLVLSNDEMVSYSIQKVMPKKECYSELQRGIKTTKYIPIKEEFVVDRLRDLRLRSQLNFINSYRHGLQTDNERLLLTASLSNINQNYHVVPNKNYSPDMYARDSFWSIVGINNKVLNEKVLEKFEKTQNDDGCIATIITPQTGSIEKKGNEATLEFLWWNYLNKKRGYKMSSVESISKAVKYIIRTFDPQMTGICSSEFVLGQNDIIDYLGNPRSDICVNQGMYAVTLRVIKALGYKVDEQLIEVATKNYVDYYDTERQRLINNREIESTFSYGDLLPAFVYFWLFDEKVFTDQQMKNILDSYHDEEGIGLFIGDYETKYIETTNNPFNPGFSYPDGEYYNGGSWLREECCAYLLGIVHGVSGYDERLDKRIEAEFNYFVDEPFSHEHINLNQAVTTSKKSTVMFAWNCFVLEVLRIRRRI